MYGGDESYYLEQGLNLNPVDDFLPEDYQQNQNHYAAMQNVMAQQRVAVRVNNYDYTADAVRRAQQAAMQQQQVLRRNDFAEMQQNQNNARERRELEEERRQIAVERQRLLDAQRQPFTDVQLSEIAQRIRETMRPTAPLTPQQQQAERDALYQQVYGEVSEQQPSDVIQQPEHVGETFGIDEVVAMPALKPVVVVGE